jgi:hypothetical protein
MFQIDFEWIFYFSLHLFEQSLSSFTQSFRLLLSRGSKFVSYHFLRSLRTLFGQTNLALSKRNSACYVGFLHQLLSWLLNWCIRVGIRVSCRCCLWCRCSGDITSTLLSTRYMQCLWITLTVNSIVSLLLLLLWNSRTINGLASTTLISTAMRMCADRVWRYFFHSTPSILTILQFLSCRPSSRNSTHSCR